MSSIKRKIITRFGIVYLIMLVAFIAVIVKVVQIQYVESDNWLLTDKANKKDSLIVYANRGNIYSEEGKLMASSIPYYKLYLDFNIQPYTVTRRDTNGKPIKIKGKLVIDTIYYEKDLYENIDSLAHCLSNLLQDRSKAQYKADILKAYNKTRNRTINGKTVTVRDYRYLLYPKEVSYVDYQTIAKFPFFRKGQNKSGFYTEVRLVRKHPFGSLAGRTIGGIYKSSGEGNSGLEMQYNEILTGTNGISTRQKVGGERISINQVEPIDGIDIVTTINVNIQDITEDALRKKLSALNADEGCAIIMEVKTGEVKAIANLVRGKDGFYYESKNVAFGSAIEPGSTFKVASMMVALEKNVVKPQDSIETGKGIYYFGKTEMKDHNWHKGGYGKISASDVIRYSSNIGIARIIDENFRKNPEEFVDGLYKIKLHEAVDMEIPGSGEPYIPHPKDKTVDWDRTKLPWMSIGYNTQIPPIYTLMFYNAIANDGKMIKPFFVKNYRQNGEVIQTFQTTVINPSICSQHTLNQIKPMLESVVEAGTAKEAKSDAFKIAGKTGTAQIYYGNDRRNIRHQVSFCGYFPADKPEYTCIVFIRNPRNGIVSGGQMAGTVFKEIAEKVYARNAALSIMPADSTVIMTPVTKNGNHKELNTILSYLKIATDDQAVNNQNWVRTEATKEGVVIHPLLISIHTVPDVSGMSAKDAVFILENAGLKVTQINGSGTVKNQSLPPNSNFTKGQRITLTLR